MFRFVGRAAVVAVVLSGCTVPARESRPPVSARSASEGSAARRSPQAGPLAVLRSTVAGARTEPTMVEVTVEGLWREGDIVRLALRGRAVDGPDVFSGELIGGGLGPSCGIRLFDLGRREVYPARWCSGIALSSRRGAAPFIAEFAVPRDVGQVRVLLGRGSELGPLPIGSAPPVDVPTSRAADRSAVEPGGQPMVVVSHQPGGLRKVDNGVRAELAIPADVLFEKDSRQLDPAARQVILEVAERLAGLPSGAVVAVIGHTDDDGTDAYNEVLARDRAEAVRVALIAALGGRGPALVAEGRGEREPVAPNRDVTGRAIPANQALNRRVALAVPQGIELPPRFEKSAGWTVLPDAQPTDEGVEPEGSLAVGTAGWADDPALRYRLDVIRVHRADGAIGVSLAVQLLSGDNDSRWGALFSRIERTDGEIRFDDLTDQARSVRGLRLVRPDELVGPFRDAEGSPVGTRSFLTHLAVGHPLELVAWFPDPDPTAATVDLMVPSFGIFRGLPIS